MNLETIDIELVGMSSAEMLVIWQDALDERMGLPPNERHAELSAIIDRIALAFGNKVEAEYDAGLAEVEAARVANAAEAAAMAKLNGPDVPQLRYNMKLAVWAVTRAIGADACRAQCERDIVACVADDLVQ